MNTKYGEVKSIYDLFEDKKEMSRHKGQAGDVIYSDIKCKICGERVRGMDETGECWAYNNEQENHHLLSRQMIKHIEFHKTLKLLTS